MANKINNVIANLAAGLASITGPATTAGKSLRAVRRALFTPDMVALPPALGIVLDNFHREGDTWISIVALRLAANKGGLEFDQSITELVAAIQDSVEAVEAAGALGGTIDDFKWQVWYMPSANPSGLDQVGAVGELRIRTSGPLLIPVS